MKHFLIRYQFKTGSPEDWHREIARFVAALDRDPVLTGRISYRCLKRKDGTDYYHLAAAVDDETIKILQARDFFAPYSAGIRRAAGGEMEFVPLELIAETVPLQS